MGDKPDCLGTCLPPRSVDSSPTCSSARTSRRAISSSSANGWRTSTTRANASEGDWEFVQLGCTDRKGDKPVLVTASQHRTGQKREFWRCELERGRPVIYVALGSHANFFSAGDRGQYKADGLGTKLSNIQWREFGDSDPWTGWAGRWGNSTGPGRSPESPRCQGERWHAPDMYHAEAG